MMVVVFFYFGLDEFFLLFFFFYPLNIVLERGFVEVKNRHLSLNKLFISVSLKRDYRYWFLVYVGNYYEFYIILNWDKKCRFF